FASNLTLLKSRMNESSKENRTSPEIILLDDDNKSNLRQSTSAASSEAPHWSFRIMEMQVAEMNRKEREWKDKEKNYSAENDDLRQKVTKWKDKYQGAINERDAEKARVKDLIENNPNDPATEVIKLRQKVTDLENTLEEEQQLNLERKPVVIRDSRVNELQLRVADLENQLKESKMKIDALTKNDQATSNEMPIEEIVNEIMMNGEIARADEAEQGRQGRTALDILNEHFPIHQKEDPSEKKKRGRKNRKEKMNEENQEEEGEGKIPKVVEGDMKKKVVATRTNHSSILTRSKGLSKIAVARGRYPKRKRGGKDLEIDPPSPRALSPSNSLVLPPDQLNSKLEYENSLTTSNKEEMAKGAINDIFTTGSDDDEWGEPSERVAASHEKSQPDPLKKLKKTKSDLSKKDISRKSGEEEMNDEENEQNEECDDNMEEEAERITPMDGTLEKKERLGEMMNIPEMEIDHSSPQSSSSLILPSLPLSGTPAVEEMSMEDAEKSLMEARLHNIIVDVFKEKMKMEKAVHEVFTMKMSMKTIAKCFIEAHPELPQKSTWPEVLKKMKMGVSNINEMKGVVPKAEMNFFELLKAIRRKEALRLDSLCRTFDRDLRDIFMASTPYNKSTDKVTRDIRCLFLAHAAAQNTGYRDIFRHILTKQSSQAVCQSLVYLFSNHDTTSMANEIVEDALDYSYNTTGRLLLMHIQDETAKVLKWAIDRFGGTYCKALASYKFTPATQQMVHEWWDSDMKEVEKAKKRKLSVKVNQHGIKIDQAHSAILDRMSELIYAQTNIEGLDRAKLLTQMITPAISAVDRESSSTSGQNARVDPSEGRVVIIKIRTAMAALKHYENRVLDKDQGDIHTFLINSVDKITEILDRSLCKEVLESPSSSSKENYLPLIITEMKEWKDMAEKLTKKDSMNSASSREEWNPLKKRGRREENTADPSSDDEAIARPTSTPPTDNQPTLVDASPLPLPTETHKSPLSDARKTSVEKPDGCARKRRLDWRAMSGQPSAENETSIANQAIDGPPPTLPKEDQPTTVDCKRILSNAREMNGESSGVDLSPIESQLITTLIQVCKDEKTVEAVSEENLKIADSMDAKTIAKCFHKVLLELPTKKTWVNVLMNVLKNVEKVDITEVVPKEELNFFEILTTTLEDDALTELFDCFYEECFCYMVTSSSRRMETCEVIKHVRCLFFALARSKKTEEERVNSAQYLFHDLLAKQSSQAVCQSLVYLLLSPETSSLVSETLAKELEEVTFRRRLTSMRENAGRELIPDLEVLIWAVNLFADPSCKETVIGWLRNPEMEKVKDLTTKASKGEGSPEKKRARREESPKDQPSDGPLLESLHLPSPVTSSSAAQGSSSIAPSSSSGSQLVNTVSGVCKEENAEEVVKEEIMLIASKDVKTIAQYFRKVLLNIRPTSTWLVVKDMLEKEENVDIKKIVPQEEAVLFEWLSAMRVNDPVRLADI
ncbi:hypothetical protein PMAYCL1PPCAC_24756, partial [Pristionchus mayeri]